MREGGRRRVREGEKEKEGGREGAREGIKPIVTCTCVLMAKLSSHSGRCRRVHVHIHACA